MQGWGTRLVWLLALAWLCLVLGGEGEDGEVVVEEEDEALSDELGEEDDVLVLHEHNFARALNEHQLLLVEEDDEALSDELGEEDDVLVLHEHNFARALNEHQLLLVEFYAPWCGHCERLAPAFAQAAAALKNESSLARLGKVDATAQKALASKFGVTSYPTLKLFRDGNRTHPLAYTGRMDAEGIVRWMQRRAGPRATLLQDTDTAAAFISSQDLVVIGFFKDLQGQAAQAFYEVAGEVVDVPFGVAEAAELFQVYGLSADTVCLFKKFDEGRTDFPVDPARGLDVAELTQLLRVHSLELVMEFTNETSEQIFGAKIPHHMLLFLNKSSPVQLALRDGFRVAAGAFRGKVLFVVVDVTGHGAHVLPFFGMTPTDAPTLRLVKMENNHKYRMDQDAFSEVAIRTFVQAVLDGKVKPYLLSAEPPEGWDTRPVKVLVGKTFEQVAFDETKNVFVKFYAPWCSHCQAMAAAWEELGERYKDHEDIVIAELDATANELENITINGFPTLHYFPAGPGRKMVEYKSTRDVETFSKFLENGGTLPEEPPAVSQTPENSTGSKEPSSLGTAESRDEL
ncbi:protein disulfide-isomerase A2 [Patagioenas fasciata monilis]|uniref:protein disulfide-isomerase n=1 Tax=Patagioenas fasciata monilis TaxID=372326 RepID=A0A1V4KTK4_PATFA|nr:protein disulfide-isomerase A2 [Patagioenas fasciata monilis]